MWGLRKKQPGGNGKIDNHWRHGKVHWVVPPLPPEWIGKSMARIETRTMDEKVGPETVLYIFERPEHIGPIARANPFTLRVANGLARTDHGSVLFLIYKVYSRDRFVCLFESYVDPKGQETLNKLSAWGNQTHLKILVVDSMSSEVEGFFEIESTFEVDTLLEATAIAAANEADADFEQAQRDFANEYSIEDLAAL